MADIIIWNTAYRIPNRPLGAHQIASWLRANGYTVKVIDFCNKIAEININYLVDITLKHVDNTTIAIGISANYLEFEGANDDQLPEWVNSARSIIDGSNYTLEWIIGAQNMGWFDHPGWKVFSGKIENDVLEWVDSKSGRKPLVINLTYRNITTDPINQTILFNRMR